MSLCPRCNDWLAQVRTPQGVAYGCPKCKGRAVGLPVLRRVVPEKLLKDLWLRARECDEHPSGAECPICHGTMAEVPVATEGRPVALNVCTACQFVWFDASQFEQLPQQPPEQRERDLPEKARETLALMQLKHLERREQLENLEPGFEEDGWAPLLLRLFLGG
jgi:Zn-finger nucleic acid-binding protein